MARNESSQEDSEKACASLLKMKESLQKSTAEWKGKSADGIASLLEDVHDLHQRFSEARTAPDIDTLTLEFKHLRREVTLIVRATRVKRDPNFSRDSFWNRVRMSSLQTI